MIRRARASLRAKLTMGFGVLVLALAANSLVGYWSVARLAASTDGLELAVEKRRLAHAMQFALEQQRAGTRGVLLGSNQQDEIEDGRRDFREAADKLQSLLKTDEGKKRFADLLRTSDEYGRLLDRELQLRKSGKTKEAVALCLGPEAAEVRRSVKTAIDALARLQADERNAAVEHQHAAESETRLLLAIFASLGLVSGVVVAVVLPRSLSRTISAMMSVIHAIAENNLSSDDLPVTSGDELGGANTALNSMKNNLRALIQSIARTAEHVASASEEISSSATQQAQGAETQKGQANQVAVAMQEMSGTVREVSENSNRAADASRQAAETAREGGKIVEESLAKMRAIAESVTTTAHRVEDLGKSSDQIGRIIGVIDDIADQTNLLALNAAIEAARAGAQGRGFAVVADEVRKLAERTTSATKEVAQMVQSIQSETKNAVAAMHSGTNQVQEGVQTTARAGDSLKQIIQMAEQVGEMITHIATAATQQSAATEQVNQNVEQITRLVNESAIGAQQSAKACQDLSGLALDLQKLVSSFNLDGNRDSVMTHSPRSQTAEKETLDADRKAFAAGAR